MGMVTQLSNGKQTIKLYRSVNRGKPMYQLSYYFGGRRVQKNFSTKLEAKRIASIILNSLSIAAVDVDDLTAAELESFVAARRVLAPNYALHIAVEEHAYAVAKLGRATLREAVEFFCRHNPADAPRLTLLEIAEQFAKSRGQSGLSSQYVSSCRKAIKDLAMAFPGRTLSDLKPTELDAWLGSLDLGAKTKNYMLCLLRTCGHWAEGHGYLIKNTSPFPAMVRYKENKGPVPIFTPGQIASLLGKAKASLRPFLALGAFAGLRSTEVQRLDWSEINLERNFVTVAASKAKTQQRRVVPISENLKLWLLPARQPSGAVCRHRRPQMAAARLCEGFAWQDNGLRHSFISYRLAILEDTARVALEAGNSPQMIFTHYRELVAPEMAKAWFEVKP
jgi:integrase